MSTVCEVWARRDIPASGKLVFAALYAKRNENGLAWPKVKTIAEEIGQSERAVGRALQALVGKGLIEVHSKLRSNITKWQVVRTKRPKQNEVTSDKTSEANTLDRTKRPKRSRQDVRSGSDKTSEAIKDDLNQGEKSEKKEEPAAAGDGAAVRSARLLAADREKTRSPAKKAKKPSRKKAGAKGKKKAGRRDPHAERFKELYDSKNEVPYSWTTGDFVQKKKWLENYPGVSPEDFARFAARCWDSGNRFIKSLALTIRSLYVNWSKLHALLEDQRSTTPLFTAQQEEYMDQFAESCNAQ